MTQPQTLADAVWEDSLRSWYRSPTRGEAVHGPLSAAEHIEALMTEHHDQTVLRAFTIRTMKRMPTGTVESLFAVARRHGWHGHWGAPETDEYDSLIFINEVVS